LEEKATVKDYLTVQKEGSREVQRRIQIYSLDMILKALTPKRLELLHIIKAKKPSSINELARFAKRDVKNIADDVNYLEQIGLIQKKESASKTAPVITYDKIALEIAV